MGSVVVFILFFFFLIIPSQLGDKVLYAPYDRVDGWGAAHCKATQSMDMNEVQHGNSSDQRDTGEIVIMKIFFWQTV